MRNKLVRAATWTMAAGGLFIVLSVIFGGDTAKPAKATATPVAATTKRVDLSAIDPRMAAHSARYADRAAATCEMVRANHWTHAKYVALTVERFRGGDMPDFTTAQAEQVLKTCT